MAKVAFKEKRGFVRLRTETRVTFTINDNPQQAHDGQCHDLSAAGLSMNTFSRLEINDTVHIIMNPKNSRLPPFTSIGTVIDIGPYQSTTGTRVSIRFL